MSIRSHLRIALRNWLRHPWFAVAVVTTLAVSLAVSTAMFAVFDAVVLHQFPYRMPQQLVQVLALNSFGHGMGIDVDEFEAIERAVHSLTKAAIYTSREMVVKNPKPELVRTNLTTDSFFDVLGVMPFLGSDAFNAAEGEIAVLDYSFWKNRLNGDLGVIGTTLELTEPRQNIVRLARVGAVMPQGFHFPPSPAAPSDLWLVARSNAFRSDRSFRILGRLKERATPSEVESELRVIASRLWPGMNRELRHAFFKHQYLQEGETTTYGLFLSGLLLMAVTMTNLTHMLAARIVNHGRDIAIHSVLGASRKDLVCTILTEASVYTVTACVLGLIITPGVLNVFFIFTSRAAVAPDRIQFDYQAFLFALVLTTISSVLVALAPILEISKRDLIEPIKMGNVGFLKNQSTGRWKGLLIASQISFAVVLAVGAVVAYTNLAKVSSKPLGFNPKGVLVVPQIDLAFSASYDPPARRAELTDRILRTLQRLPRAQYVGLVAPDLFDDETSGPMRPRGRQTTQLFLPGNPEGTALIRWVNSDYFAAMQIPLSAGRFFNKNDTTSSVKVAIITESLARRYWPGQSPLGVTLAFDDAVRPSLAEIVGIVPNIEGLGLNFSPTVPQLKQLLDEYRTAPMLFLSAQQYRLPIATFVVRFEGASPQQIASVADRELRAAAPDLPLRKALSLEDLLWYATSEMRLRTVVVGLLSGVATVLALLGVYGAVVYRMIFRRRDIGIRKALGANTVQVVTHYCLTEMTPIFLGCLCGMALAILSSRLVSILVYDAQVPMFAVITIPIVFLAAAFAAISVPVWFAARTEPAAILRHD